MTIPSIIDAGYIAALETALGSGVLEVEYSSGDKTHRKRFASASELLKALEYARARYAEQLSGSSQAVPSTFGVFSRT